MIPAFYRQENRKGTSVKRYNTLNSQKSLPVVFRKHYSTKKTLFNYQNQKQMIKKKIFWLGLISSSLGILVILLNFYDSELLYQEYYSVSPNLNILRSFILIICCIHVIIVFKIQVIPHFPKEENFSAQVKLIYANNKKRYIFIAEVFICMIHTPPGLSATFTFYQLGNYSILSYSDIIFPLSLLKLYFFLSFILKFSVYNDSKSKFTLKLFNTTNHNLFILKSYVHNRPFITSIIGLITTILLMGTLLRVFEKSVAPMSLWDEFWIIFETASTIGYGEFVPSTHIGRLLCGITAIIGVFIFSYNVMAVRDFSQLTQDELNMSKILRHQKIVSTKLANRAVELIAKWWRSRREKKVESIFTVIEESKRFGFFRKCLNQDLQITLKQQIMESSKDFSKIFESGAKVFENIQNVGKKSNRFMAAKYSNLRKFRRLKKNDEREEQGFVQRKSFNSLLPMTPNIMALRSKAVKNMFIRRSPVASSNPSPSVTFVDLEQLN